MGRIKTKQIKRITFQLMDKYGEKFSTDFTKNKEILGSVADIKSKKLKNVISGYLSRQVKQKDDERPRIKTKENY